MERRSSSNNDETKSSNQQKGWKILKTLNKQVFDASNIFVNSMRDFLGPNCRERIIKVQNNLVKIQASEIDNTKNSLEKLENSIVVDKNNSDDADIALKSLEQSRINIYISCVYYNINNITSKFSAFSYPSFYCLLLHFIIYIYISCVY